MNFPPHRMQIPSKTKYILKRKKEPNYQYLHFSRYLEFENITSKIVSNKKDKFQFTGKRWTKFCINNIYISQNKG